MSTGDGLSLSQLSLEERPSPEISPTSTRSFQRLPDECLLLIVDCLHGDLKTLTTLLVVNRFLFKAALPLIYGDPFNSWQLDYHKSPHFKKRGRMMALIFSSLFKYQSQKAGVSVETFLSSCGIRLPKPAHFPELKMYLSGEGDQETRTLKLPTVDYSSYFTTLSPYQFDCLDFRPLVQLKQLPTLLQQDGPQDPAQDIPDQNNDSESVVSENSLPVEETHADWQQLDQNYRTILKYTLMLMLLCLNHEFLRTIEMHTSSSDTFLFQANHFKRLSTIILHRDDNLPIEHLQNIIIGIERHKAAFPSKPALKVRFFSGWHHLHHTAPFFSVSEIMLVRRRLQTPQAVIYKALGRPVDMEAGEYPDFYGNCLDIEPDCIRKFKDEYMDRVDNGEGAAREAFLGRCTALEELSLGIGTPYDLTWAANYAMSGASSTTNGPSVHPKLRSIRLTSYRPTRYLVLAMNDAMTAYSESLQSIYLHSSYYNEDEVGVSVELQNSREALAKQLQTVPRACNIGDWTFKLPSLRSIYISVFGIASLSIGSLDQCPNLESLHIDYGGYRQYHDEDEEMFGAPSQQEFLEQEAGLPGQQSNPTLPVRPMIPAYLNKMTTLFPKWTLPRLRSLRLCNTPALRFDYESLNSMQALEFLEIVVSHKATPLLDYVHLVPRLSAHTSRPAPLEKNQDQTLEAEGYMDSSVWTATWHLPFLKTLRMEGPPAHVFSVSWLKACPRLSTVRLTNWGSPQRIPVHAHSSLSYSIPAAPEPTKRMTRPTMSPLLDSVLAFILLEGPWVMTRGDIVELLTVYAPHLQRLNVGVLNDRATGKGCGYRIAKAISIADEINKAYIEQHVPEFLELVRTGISELRKLGQAWQDGPQDKETQEQDRARLNRLKELGKLVPGQKLNTISSHYRVSKWGCRDLELESTDKFYKGQFPVVQDIHKAPQFGLARPSRVYKFSGQELKHLKL